MDTAHRTQTFAGKTFHGVTEAMSAAQDDFIMTQLRRAGATELLLGMEGITNDERLARSREMFDRIVESGRKYKLLAGLLVEEGKPWNQTDAEEHAGRFSAITDMTEKLTMNRELMRYVQFFFPLAQESSTISPNSSSQNSAAPDIENAEAATLETSHSSSAQ